MSIRSRLVFEERELQIPGIHGLGQYCYSTAGPGLATHQHRGCMEISLISKGTQTFQVGGQVYNLKGGEQFIAMPDELHDTAGQPEEKGVAYWLILDVTRNRDNFLFLNPTAANKLIEDLHKIPSRHFISDPESQSTLDKAFRDLQKIRTASERRGIFEHNLTYESSLVAPERVASYELSVVGHLLTYITQTIHASHAKPGQPSPAIQASLDFIAQHDNEWITVAEIAEKLHMPEAHFRLSFRREMGVPPAEYLLRRKIDVAKMRLAQPRSNITEVAYSLGFSSSQYFATVFRRFTNLTPSEFLEGRPAKLTPIIERE